MAMKGNPGRSDSGGRGGGPFNLGKALDVAEFQRSLGTLLRNLRYR